ncbi:hypothetical protein, partial [Enterobacter cloacae]
TRNRPSVSPVHSHAYPVKSLCGLLAGFRDEDVVFYGSGRKIALNASEAVPTTDVMVNYPLV